MANYTDLFYNKVVEKKHENTFSKILERVDYSDFSNYVYFGSAYYLMESMLKKIIKEYPINLTSASSSDSNLVEKYDLYIEEVSPLERYLVAQFPNTVLLQTHDGTTGNYVNIYRDTYNNLLEQTDIDFIEATLTDADKYDSGNEHKIQDLVPQYLIENDDTETLRKFLHIIGLTYDSYKIAIDQLSKVLHTNYTEYNKFPKGSETYVSELLGFNLIDGQFERVLAQYLLRDNLGNNLKTVTEKIWNRILNNIPYIYKTKGTMESIKAILNCYGISEDLIRIKEYGYTKEPVTIDVKLGTTTTQQSHVGKFVDNDKIKVGTKTDGVVNTTEISIGFEPIDEIDDNIVDTFSISGISLDIANLVGYTDIYQSDGKYKRTYEKLDEQASLYFINKTYDLNKFIRFIEDFDKGTIQTIKQLLPARTKLVNDGITINQHILERTRVTDGKLFDYNVIKNPFEIDILDIESESVLHSSIIDNIAELVAQSVTYSTETPSIATIESESVRKDFELYEIFEKTDSDLDDNVLSTMEITNLELENLTNNVLESEAKYYYENKYYVEDRVIRIDTNSALDLNLVATLNSTSSLTSGSTTSITCNISYTINGKPFVFGKIKIKLPVSSNGARLLDIYKLPDWSDYFQTMDCNESDILNNSKINIFEYYTDIAGEIKLRFDNKFLRNGEVPIYFADENLIKQSLIKLTLSGSTGAESGNYQSLDVIQGFNP